VTVHTHVLAFTGVAALLTVTPGADMAMVTRTAILDGRRAAVITAAGICSGVLVWAALSALGLAAILDASAGAFTAVRLAGGAFLIVLGVRTLWLVRRHRDNVDGAPRAARAGRSHFARGLLNNLLNPKVGLFYTVLLPQFVSTQDNVLAASLLLASIHVAMGMVWLSAYAAAVTGAGAALRRPQVRRRIESVTGLVMVGLGLRVAIES